MARACIDENTIAELFGNELPRKRVLEIDAHVSSCTTCRELLCGLARHHFSSSPSRALVETAALLDVRAHASSATSQPSLERLLALLACERRIGSVLARKWRLDAVLGVGGMAEVYAATHLTNGRRAAIKVLRREHEARPSLVQRFLREGLVANRVGHDGAVQILDDGTSDDGTPFLVLELLEGRTLSRHIAEPLPVRDVLSIASAILDVLVAAHDRQIIHRDIKPDNVFLTLHGSVKVLDFGVARIVLSAPSDAGATQQGTMLGTPAYMPPEQARGDQIDARADIYAVGATMFALFTGRAVHADASSLADVLSRPAPRLASAARIPLRPEICAIVDRALAFERDARFPDARAMKSAIDAAIRSLDDGPRFDSLSVSGWSLPAPVAARRRPAALVFATVVLAATAGVFVLARERPKSAPAQVAAAESPVALPSAAPPAPSSAAPPAAARAPKLQPGRAKWRPVVQKPPPMETSAPEVQPPPPPPPPVETHPLDVRD
jgi:eukaryotic-like serine/threonine-protein kinase